MNTPRSGLIRMTERAIKQFVKNDCETNIATINTLEDISYKLWVESNTDFLDESVVSMVEDDGWMWDDDCFFSSAETTVQDDIMNESSVSSTGSSLGSSIRICDESDCSIGYLGSCESNLDISLEHRTTPHAPETGPTGKLPVNIFSEKLDANTQFTDLNVTHVHKQCTCTCACADSAKLSQTDRSNVISERQIDTFSNVSTDDFADDSSTDEWVIVSDDCVHQTTDNDWFIISTSEQSKPIDITGRRTQCNNLHKQPSAKTSKKVSDVKPKHIDLSDWSVLSMKITEHEMDQLNETPMTGTKDSKEVVYSASDCMRQIGQLPDILSLGYCDGTNLDSRVVEDQVQRRVRRNNNDLMIVCLLMPLHCK